MENLRGLASHGATVICTTHLMEHVYLLDEVLVLGMRGHRAVPAYAGDPNELLACLGCRNFADLYEKLERGEFQPLGGFEPDSSAVPPKRGRHTLQGSVGNLGEFPSLPPGRGGRCESLRLPLSGILTLSRSVWWRIGPG
jgi:hypothetical protein